MEIFSLTFSRLHSKVAAEGTSHVSRCEVASTEAIRWLSESQIARIKNLSFLFTGGFCIIQAAVSNYGLFLDYRRTSTMEKFSEFAFNNLSEWMDTLPWPFRSKRYGTSVNGVGRSSGRYVFALKCT